MDACALACYKVAQRLVFLRINGSWSRSSQRIRGLGPVKVVLESRCESTHKTMMALFVLQDDPHNKLHDWIFRRLRQLAILAQISALGCYVALQRPKKVLVGRGRPFWTGACLPGSD